MPYLSSIPPLFALFLLLLCPISLAAQDVRVIITERALNRYASAVGSTTGFGSYSSAVTLPALRMSPRSAAFQVEMKTLCGESRWTWSVSGPRFQVTANEVRFVAFLSARAGASTFSRAIEVPVTFSFNTSTSAIELKLSEVDFPVFVGAAGEGSQIGTVNVSSAYSTTLFIPSSFSFTSDRTGTLQNINVRFSDGTIEITSQIEVR